MSRRIDIGTLILIGMFATMTARIFLWFVGIDL